MDEAQTITVSSLIYAAAGSPPMEAAHQGACRLCGRASAGAPFEAWVKDTFTDWDKLRNGTIICAACQFCASDAAPGLAERVGKHTPQRFRNYSHIVCDGTWYPLSKGSKDGLRRLLLRDPEVALIATSGQKHLFFRARPGWWQVEEVAMRPEPDALAAILAIITPMLAVFSKAEVATGRYEQRRILSYGTAAWYAAERRLSALRGSLVLDLALFLAQKEEQADG